MWKELIKRKSFRLGLLISLTYGILSLIYFFILMQQEGTTKVIEVILNYSIANGLIATIGMIIVGVCSDIEIHIKRKNMERKNTYSFGLISGVLSVPFLIFTVAVGIGILFTTLMLGTIVVISLFNLTGITTPVVSYINEKLIMKLLWEINQFIVNNFQNFESLFLQLIIFWSIITYCFPPVVKGIKRILKNVPALYETFYLLSFISVDVIRCFTYLLAFCIYINTYLNREAEVIGIINESLLAFIIIDVALNIFYKVYCKIINKRKKRKKFLNLNLMLEEVQDIKFNIVKYKALNDKSVNTRLYLYTVNNLMNSYENRLNKRLIRSLLILIKLWDRYNGNNKTIKYIQKYFSNKKLVELLIKRQVIELRSCTYQQKKKYLKRQTVQKCNVTNSDIMIDICNMEKELYIELYKLVSDG